MPIFWRPALAIGHEDIDADHRYLILLINTVELVLRFPEQPDHVRLAFDELQRYARHHFEREEKIQVACGYPHFDQHKLEHSRLLEALADLRSRVERAVASPDTAQQLAAQSGSITTFLRGWLIDHVLKSDSKLTTLFRKMPRV